VEQPVRRFLLAGWSRIHSGYSAPALGAIYEAGVLCSRIADWPSCHLPFFSSFQLGNFRLGLQDKEHFVISHRDSVVVVCKRDGTHYLGKGNVMSGFNLKDKPLANEPLSPEKHGIIFGDRYIEFRPTSTMGGGDTWFRISAYSANRLIIHSDEGKTAISYTSDGKRHRGPSNSYPSLFGPARPDGTGPGSDKYRASAPNGISAGIGILHVHALLRCVCIYMCMRICIFAIASCMYVEPDCFG